MTRDRLFLLRPDFEDPAYPGRRFYCSHCALIEACSPRFRRWLIGSTSNASPGRARAKT